MSFSDIASRLRKHSDEKAAKSEEPRNFEELYLLRARILGVLIRDARQTANLDLNDCAALIGVTPDTLAAWEFGQAMPSLPQLELLAYHLDVPISHFWGTETLLQPARHNAVDTGQYVLLRGRLIGALLRGAREQNNLTQEQVAAEAGLTAEHIDAYELGLRPIPLPVLVTLAHAVKVNLSYFLEDGNRIGDSLAMQADLKAIADMPDEMRRFVAAPVNQAYLELAMRLAQMSSNELRAIAEAILNITL
ncbi:MAG: transcriptional regulator [Anaerolineae bacterium]|nr:transcriptional regulator [Anaerolineae bacterium]